MCKKYLFITALSVMCVIHLSHSATSGGWMGSGSSGNGAWGMYNILIAPHTVGSTAYYQVILKAPFSATELQDRSISPLPLQSHTFVYDPTTTTGKKITSVILSALSSGLPICICVNPSPTVQNITGYGYSIYVKDVSLATY